MKHHRIDPISLLFGLLFLGLAGWWLVGRVAHLSAASAGWAAATALLALGVIGIVTSILGNRPQTEISPDEPSDT